jgi:hypothetical protein
VKGSDRGLFYHSTSLDEGLRKIMKNSVRMAGVLTEI